MQGQNGTEWNRGIVTQGGLGGNKSEVIIYIYMLDHRLHPRDFYAQDVKRPFGVYGLGCCQYRNGAVVLLASLGSVATSFGRGRSPLRSVPLDHRHGTGDIPSILFWG